MFGKTLEKLLIFPLLGQIHGWCLAKLYALQFVTRGIFNRQAE
jgi:hypothetical protein